MGILFVPMFIAGIIMLGKNPELLQKRLDAKEKEAEQKSVVRHELPNSSSIELDPMASNVYKTLGNHFCRMAVACFIPLSSKTWPWP